MNVKDIEMKYNSYIECIMKTIGNKTLSEGVKELNAFVNTFEDKDIEFSVFDDSAKAYFDGGEFKGILYYSIQGGPEYVAVRYVRYADKKDYVEWKSCPFLGKKSVE